MVALARIALTAFMFASISDLAFATLPPQGEQTPDPCGGVIAFAWVDPVFGVDKPMVWPDPPGFPASAQVNDPTQPFKTLQAAIDAVFSHQNLFHQANVPTEGIVFALPGIYGPLDGGGAETLFR